MSGDDIFELGATALSYEVRRRRVSPVEVISRFVERVERVNPLINAIVTMNPLARREAEELERNLALGYPVGPLAGVPFTVKDAYDTSGVRTTRGSKLFEDNIPDHDATAVRRLREAGAILLGKTNLPEFCLSAETDNLVFGLTKNPWNVTHSPGGSSGGEGAAIAARLSPLGIGSDQGGSVRLPAHFCGVVGFKPTLGRIPITGHWPDSLHRYATAGVMARHVEDIRRALLITAGSDGYDWAAQLPAISKTSVQSCEQLRIGYIGGDWLGPLDAEISTTVRVAADRLAGHVASVVRIPDDFFTPIDYDVLSEGLYRAEGAVDLARIIRGHEGLLHPWTLGGLAHATSDLSVYLDSMTRIEDLKREIQHLFREIDILVCPVAPTVAPLSSGKYTVVGGRKLRLRAINRALQPFNLSGNPAISVPYCLSSENLPIGIQLVGPKFEEEMVLRAAEMVERTRPAGINFPAPVGLD